MKKVLSIVLTLALLVTLAACLGGCKKEEKPLRVFIDLGIGVHFLEDDVEDPILREDVHALLKAMIEDGIPADTEFEIIPSSGSERSSALTRIRAEMMAGTGPDVFIVGQSEATDNSNDALFLMPEKSMSLGLFYPLDDLIENNTRYMDWNDLNQTIMAAGYDEEYGQVLIPLGYEMPVTLFLANDVDHTPSTEYTWEDALNDDTGVLAAAARTVRTHNCIGSEVLGKLADYRAKKLTFTEEDLYRIIDEMTRLDRNLDDNTYKGLPTYCSTVTNSSLAYAYPEGTQYPLYRGDFHGATNFHEFFNYYNDFLDKANQGSKKSETDVTMVPAYSITGGATATVRFFAAINATTKRPEDAFSVIDCLFNEEYLQERFDFRSDNLRQPWEVYAFMYRNTLPVQNSLITGETHAVMGPELSEYNAQSLFRATEAITVVRFADTLEQELNQLLLFGVLDKLGVLQGEYAKDMDELIPSTYTRMKRELSE